MIKSKKILTFSLLTLFLLLLTGACSFSAFAAETVTEAPAITASVTVTEAVTITEAPVVSDSAENPLSTVSRQLLSFFEGYSSEIFSVLTLIGSFVLMLLYRKGLLPMLRNALTRIAEKVGESACDTARLSEQTVAGISTLNDRLAEIEARFAAMEQNVEGQRRTLSAVADITQRRQDDGARVASLLKGQTQMLYGVFSNANLPVYVKEQIAQCYTALLAEAAALTNDNPTETEG